MTRLCASLALTLGLGSLVIGCGDPSRRGYVASGQNQAVSTPAVPQGSPTTGQAAGVVRQLTGDPDDQVTSEVQVLVLRADRLGETDAPLDF